MAEQSFCLCETIEVFKLGFIHDFQMTGVRVGN